MPQKNTHAELLPILQSLPRIEWFIGTQLQIRMSEMIQEGGRGEGILHV